MNNNVHSFFGSLGGHSLVILWGQEEGGKVWVDM